MEGNNNDADIFVYTEGAIVPRDVVRARIDPSVTLIPPRAFSERKKLVDVELGEGIQQIGEDAFKSCDALKRISIPSTVTIIGEDAFHWCEKLKRVILLQEGLEEIGERAFYWNRLLENITIPSTVRVIHKQAYASCYKLQDINLSEGLIVIGEKAFQHCGAVQLNIPSSVTTIHKNAFSYSEKLEEVELCEGLQEIGEYAFFECPLKSINIPSTMNRIPKGAFKNCQKLEIVTLCDGLLEIGDSAFYGCWGIENMTIPTTVKTIGDWAFGHLDGLQSLHLHDGMESIGSYAFCQCRFSNLRMPPLITTIIDSMFHGCKSMVSVELSGSITHIKDGAFCECTALRNIALPSNAEIKADAFKDCTCLKQLFGSNRRIVNALKLRFDDLPIHKMIYYQSYNNLTPDQLNTAVSDKDATGNQQDCLGMTPLHVLACSSVQNIKLYKLLIEKYPESLITEDRWGAVPLFYAVWGSAPNGTRPEKIETIQFLVESHLSLYPDHEFNWTVMMETLGIGDVSSRILSRLHRVQNQSFPNQLVDWNSVLEKAISFSDFNLSPFIAMETFRHIAWNSIRVRVCKFWGVKVWHDQMFEALLEDLSHDGNKAAARRDFLANIHTNLSFCEGEYKKLNEAFTMIELVLWEMRIDDYCQETNGKRRSSRRNKKIRIDDADIRKQCRMRCGASISIVVQHVMPFLLPEVTEEDG